MSYRFSNFIWNIVRKLELGTVVLKIHPKSALRTLGWFISFKKKYPVDKNGLPLPWWTYSIISFLDDRLSSKLRVLEFGCGNSSLWLSKRVEEVISIENKMIWANHIQTKAPNNLKIITCSCLEEFAATSLKECGEFNILIIDAGNRMKCAKYSLSALSEDGIVIWDDTERADWPEINNYMKSFGFKELSFAGLKPQVIHFSRTTIFYKDKNCLAI